MVDLLLRQLFLAIFELGIGLLFDFGQDFLCAHTWWQLADYGAPLATRQFFDFIAGTHAHTAFACGVSVFNVFRGGNDVRTASKIRALDVFQQFCDRHVRLFQQSDGGLGDFVQIVRRDFRGHAHGNARSAIEQNHGQTGGQVSGLDKRAIVIGNEIHRALVQL